jgi:tRNA A37 threonylcarbamoyladenosine synthetase subunit TsaC/SUA5/YrdC
VLIASPRDLPRCVAPPAPRVARVLRACWPGALTAVLPGRRRNLPPGVGTDGTVGVRVPRHARLLRLLRAAGPLATTSANRSGEPPLRTASGAARRWPGRIGVLPGRAGRAPSTVADFTRWPPRVLREGAISARKLAGIALAAGRLRAGRGVGYRGVFRKGGPQNTHA